MGNAVCKPKAFKKANVLASSQGDGSKPPEPAKPWKGNPDTKPVEDTPMDVPHVELDPDPVEVRALVTYCDYGFEPARGQGWVPPGFPGGTLDTKENADMIVELLQSAGVTDITRISNLDATKEDVIAKIAEVGAKCDSNDLFFFFYSGHGDRMADYDGDEDDGKDEAMCLPSKFGTCDQSTWLSDDDFSEAVAAVAADQKLIIIDCCHSGTLLDFDKPVWAGQKAISITGCKDTQEGAAMGGGTRGGAFSKALTAAVKAIGDQECDVATVYNYCLEYGPSFIPPGHQQEIQLHCSPGIEPWQMPWPIPYRG